MSRITAQQNQRIPLYALLTSYGTVHFGVLLMMVALPWFVLEMTGSAARTGLTTAVHGIPMVITGIFGGVIVDRLGFRRTMIISDVMGALAFGMIPLLHLTIGITFWQLLVFVFIGAIFDTPGFTSRLSMMPDIARRAGLRLERANSISQTLSQASILLAPALAGILIGIIGASAVIWVATGLFLISGAAVLIFVPFQVAGARPESATSDRYISELKRGFAFLLNTRLILALMLSVAAIQFLRANLMVIMPVYAHDFFESASDFGFMFAATGAGGLTSSILYGIWGHKLPRRPIVLVGVVSSIIPFWLLAATPPYWVILAGLAFTGFLAGPMIPLVFTLLQERTPAALRGRVFGLYDASMFGAMVPGRLLAGYLIEWTSIVQSLMIIGGAYIVAIGAIFANPHLRELQESAEDEDETLEPLREIPGSFRREPAAQDRER